MLEINNDKDKNITFEISLSGISSKELTGYFRILVDGIEYGFPADISEKSISVDIPSLKNIIHRTLRENEKFQSKLEVFGNGNYLNPWTGEVKIKSPVMIEAKIIESDSKKKPVIKASITSSSKEKPISKKAEVIKENKTQPKKVDSTKITNEHFYRFMEKNGTKDKRIQEVILEQCIGRVGNENPKKLFAEIFSYYKKDKKVG